MPDDEGLLLHRYAPASGCPTARRSRSAPTAASPRSTSAPRRARWAARCSPSTTTAGSEENQAGWEHHDPTLVDAESGLMDTLPTFRRTIARAGLEDQVVAVVGSVHHGLGALAHPAVAAVHRRRARRGARPERLRRLGAAGCMPGGLLVIHDVFPDPADGGRPPYDVYLRALDERRVHRGRGARVDAGASDGRRARPETSSADGQSALEAELGEVGGQGRAAHDVGAGRAVRPARRRRG